MFVNQINSAKKIYCPPSSNHEEGEQALNQEANTPQQGLFALKKNARCLILEEVVRQKIFASDSTFIKKVTQPLPPLPLSAFQLFIKEFQTLGIFNILLHLAKLNHTYPLNGSEPFKIVGSYAFWMSGLPYAEEICRKLGFSFTNILSEEEVKLTFKRPADIDIRIDFTGASKEDLRVIGLEILNYITLNYPEATVFGARRSGIDKGYSCLRVISVNMQGKKIDFTLVGKIPRPFLFGEDDYFFSFSPTLLAACIEANKESYLEISPKGNYHQGWHAIPLRLMSTKWTNHVNGIDIPGSLKFLVSLVKGATCFSAAFENRLLKNFVSILSDVRGPEKAIELLHRAINSHMPGCSSAFTAFCFNMRTLMNFHCKENANTWGNLLFKELGNGSKAEELAIQQQELATLHELMKRQLVPFDFLSAFLTVHGYLIEVRKRVLQQKVENNVSMTLATTGERAIAQLKFNKASIFLIVKSELFEEMETLIKFIEDQQLKLSLEAIKLLDKLSHSFCPLSFLPEWEKISPYQHSIEEQEAAHKAAEMALKMMECREVSSLGFMMLCLCQEVEGSFSLDKLLESLISLLTSCLYPLQRSWFFFHFLCFYKRNFPFDSFWIHSEHIKNFESLLKNSAHSSLDIRQDFCKLFALSDHTQTALFVAKEWKKMEGELKVSQWISLGNKLISHHLLNGLSSHSLSILMMLLNSKQSHYLELENKFIEITASYKSFNSFTHAESLRLAKACQQLLQRIKAPSERMPCLFIIRALIKYSLVDEAVELLDLARQKQVFPPREAARARLEIAELLFQQNERLACLEQWEKAYLLAEPALLKHSLLRFKKELASYPATSVEKTTICRLLILLILRYRGKDEEMELLQLLIEEISFCNFLPAQLAIFLQPQGIIFFQILRNYISYKSITWTPYENIIDFFSHFIAREYFQKKTNLLNSMAGHFASSLLNILAKGDFTFNIEPSLENLAKEMLDSSSLEKQLAGFFLINQCKDYLSQEEAYGKISNCLPLLIEAPESLYPAMIDLYLNSFERIFANFFETPSYLHLKDQLRATAHKKGVILALSGFLADVNHAGSFPAILEIWKKLPHFPLYGFHLLTFYFGKDFFKAKAVYELLKSHYQAEDPMIAPSMLDIFKIAQSLPHLSEEWLSLVDELFSLFMTKSKKRQSEEMAVHACWLVASLLAANTIKGRDLFNLLDSKGLFNQVKGERLALLLTITKQLFAEGHHSLAFYHVKQLICQEKSLEALQLLLSWEREELTEESFNLYAFSFQEKLFKKYALPVAEAIAKNIHLRKEKTFPINLFKLMTLLQRSSDPSLFNFIFLNVPAKELLHLLEDQSLHPLILNLFKHPSHEFFLKNWLIEALEGASAKKVNLNEETLAFYGQVGEIYSKKDVKLTYLALNRALSPQIKIENPFLLSLAIVCLESLFQLDQTSQAMYLFEKITLRFPLSGWLKPLQNCLEKNINSKLKSTFYLKLIDCLLADRSLIGLEIAATKIHRYEEFGINLKELFPVFNLIFQQFYQSKMAPESVTGMVLASFVFNLKSPIFMNRHMLDPLAVINFCSLQTDYKLLGFGICNFLNVILDDLPRISLWSGAEKKEAIFALDKILAGIKHTPYHSMAHVLLSHQNILSIFSSEDLSGRWAQLLMDDFFKEEGLEIPLGAIFNGFSSCTKYISRLTFRGPQEEKCIDKIIDAAFALYFSGSQFNAFFKVIFELFSELASLKSLTFREKWNKALSDTMNEYDRYHMKLAAEEQSLSNITGRGELFLKKLMFLFDVENIEADKKGDRKMLEFFVERLLTKLVSYQTNNLDYHRFLVANFYLYFQQACRLSLCRPEKLYKYLEAFTFRYLPMDSIDFYYVHFDMVDHLLLFTQKNFQKELNNVDCFKVELSLIIKWPTRTKISFKDQQREAFNIILSYSQQPCAGHLYRALALLLVCQTALFYNHPSYIKQIYSTLFQAVKLAPFIIFLEMKETALNTYNQPSYLLFSIGLILLQFCAPSEIFPESHEINKLKMSSLVSQLFLDYFDLVLECFEKSHEGFCYIPDHLNLVEEELLAHFEDLPQSEKGWIKTETSRQGFHSPTRLEILSFLATLFEKLAMLNFMTIRHIDRLVKLIKKLAPLAVREGCSYRNEYYSIIIKLCCEHGHHPNVRKIFRELVDSWVAILKANQLEGESDYILNSLFYKELSSEGQLTNGPIEYAALALASIFGGLIK